MCYIIETKPGLVITRNDNRQIRVLVACEYSGTVRDAFSLKGADAWSCDILPTESEFTKSEGKHYQCDVIEVLNQGWDLMIAHPPCTYLSFAYTGKDRYSNERLQKKIEAYQFFLSLLSADIPHICIENPMGYAHTGLLPYSQIIEPYFFGDHFRKKTCLWLKNLPKLIHFVTNIFEKGTEVTPTHTLINSSGKSKRKLQPIQKPFASGKERSLFSKGIANAMAEQWTTYINNINS